MKKVFSNRRRVAVAVSVALAAAAAGSGCVAIPCGTTTYTTEYPSEIRATAEKAAKTYDPSVAVAPGPDGSVDIGLFGEITTTQPRDQHYGSVSVTKRKRLAVGLWANYAEGIYHPQDALVPVWDVYLGNGTYGNDTVENPPASVAAGAILNIFSFGAVSAPFMWLHGIFGPFEHDRHYLGKTLETTVERPCGNVTKTTKTHSSRDLDLLGLFPPEDRRRIGAWCWRDNADHPQNTFWFGFTSGGCSWPFGLSCPGYLYPWSVVSKYCTYVVHDPVELERTTSAEPETAVVRGTMTGPYGVFLRIPEIGFARTLAVPRGEKTVRFELPPPERGGPDAQAFVRFLPPSGGLEEAWDDDTRSLLELADGRDFPVVLKLPLPRLGIPSTGK